MAENVYPLPAARLARIKQELVKEHQIDWRRVAKWMEMEGCSSANGYVLKVASNIAGVSHGQGSEQRPEWVVLDEPNAEPRVVAL